MIAKPKKARLLYPGDTVIFHRQVQTVQLNADHTTRVIYDDGLDVIYQPEDALSEVIDADA